LSFAPLLAAGSRNRQDGIGGRTSLVTEVGERENFNRFRAGTARHPQPRRAHHPLATTPQVTASRNDFAVPLALAPHYGSALEA
jgi:hypothetical protein